MLQNFGSDIFTLMSIHNTLWKSNIVEIYYNFEWNLSQFNFGNLKSGSYLIPIFSDFLKMSSVNQKKKDFAPMSEIVERASGVSSFWINVNKTLNKI